MEQGQLSLLLSALPVLLGLGREEWVLAVWRQVRIPIFLWLFFVVFGFDGWPSPFLVEGGRFDDFSRSLHKVSKYLSVVFLLDMGKKCGIAEVGLAAGALVISRLDGDKILVEGILGVHVTKTIIYKMGN